MLTRKTGFSRLQVELQVELGTGSVSSDPTHAAVVALGVAGSIAETGEFLWCQASADLRCRRR